MVDEESAAKHEARQRFERWTAAASSRFILRARMVGRRPQDCDVESTDFMDSFSAELWAAMDEVEEGKKSAGTPFDPGTVGLLLRRRYPDAMRRLVDLLTDRDPRTGCAEYDVERAAWEVHQAARRRELAHVCERAAAQLRDGAGDVSVCTTAGAVRAVAGAVLVRLGAAAEGYQGPFLVMEK